MSLPMPILPCTDDHCAVHGYDVHPRLEAPVPDEHARAHVSEAPPCARQILRRWDRYAAVELLTRERPLDLIGGTPFTVPLATHEPVAPGQRVEIVTCADMHVTDPGFRATFFAPKALHISAAMHDGWVVNDILLDGLSGRRSQIAPHLDLPAAMFSTTFPGISAFHTVRGDAQIRLILTRTGTTPSPLYAVMSGMAIVRPRLSNKQIRELEEAWDRIVNQKDAAEPAPVAPMKVAPAISVRMVGGGQSVRLDGDGRPRPGQSVHAAYLDAYDIAPGETLVIATHARTKAAIRRFELQMSGEPDEITGWRVLDLRVNGASRFILPDGVDAVTLAEHPDVVASHFGNVDEGDAIAIEIRNTASTRRRFRAALVGEPV